MSRAASAFCSVTGFIGIDYLERARVKPGELRHLHPNWTWERYGA